MAEKKEAVGRTKEASSLPASDVQSVASTLAAMFIADTVNKGKTVAIPSLGVTIDKGDLENPD